MHSPIQIKIADDGGGPKSPAKYWVRARKIPKMEAAFQKVRSLIHIMRSNLVSFKKAHCFDFVVHFSVHLRFEFVRED
jgi:hypothetical protein